MLLSNVLGKRPVTGQVGIEIEVEGANLPTSPQGGWIYTTDGSLRGESAEYVFNGPATIETTRRRLNSLWNTFETSNTVLNESHRTSTHVHINVLDLTVPQWFNFVVLYIIFEELLIEWCGESRKSNNFCLSAKDAEYLTYYLSTLASNPTPGMFQTLPEGSLRYAALNICATAKFGSLEFRSLRGTTDKEPILTWVMMLLRLKEMAQRYNNPAEIVTAFSDIGAVEFSQDILGEHYPTLYLEGLENMLWEGVAQAQEVAYAYNPVRTTRNWRS